MALSILDGNKTATTLSTIVTSGQHIPAHTVISLGAQAITDIQSAVGTVTANGGDFTAQNNDTAPNKAVQIGFHDSYSSGDFKKVNNDENQFPVKAYGVNPVGNPIAIPVAVGNEGNKPSTGVPIAWSDAEAPDTRIVGTDYPFPIQGTVTVGSLPIQLSTTTIGGTARLNVTLSSATTVGATAPSYANLYGGSDGTSLRAISVDTTGRTVVTGTINVNKNNSDLNFTSITSFGFSSGSNSPTFFLVNAVTGQTIYFKGDFNAGTNNVYSLQNGTDIGGGSFLVNATIPVAELNSLVTSTTFGNTNGLDFQFLPNYTNQFRFTKISGVTGNVITTNIFSVNQANYSSANPVTFGGISGSVTATPVRASSTQQSNFTNTLPSSTLISADANRKGLTIYNEGAGLLYISSGATCTTTAYQTQLFAGDYWEAPQAQVTLQHTAVFGTSGTARITAQS